MKRTIRVEVIENRGSASEVGGSVCCAALTMEPGGSLKEVLLKTGVGIVMPCGGNGRCGKCRVKFKSGAPMATEMEKELLSAEELEAGFRLICRCRPQEDCVIEILSEAEDRIAAEGIGGVAEGADEYSQAALDEAHAKGVSYGIAVDLGTTTIAAALVELSAGVNGNGDSECRRMPRIVKSAACVNSQRRYGADVISRIAAATEDEKARADMKSLAREDIEKLIRELTREGTSVSDIVIAGNTTMLHLLTGKDVSGLGVYPYTPVSLELEEMDWHGAFSDGAEAKALSPRVTLLPGISAFVGADIVSGLCYVLEDERLSKERKGLDAAAEDKPKILFIDLGTNGEMALIDGDTLKVTSTAAGPVFEAGGISCGVASVPGAIAHVSLDDNGTAGYETIGNKPPVGLCGTGVMELVSELARCKIIDETGLLAEEFFDLGFPVTEDGSIRLTQKDIRIIQMGKAAIAAGIRMITEGAVPDVVYIAGGFGSHIDIEKIGALKMLPGEFVGRCVAVGNASLKGAAKYLGDEIAAAGKNAMQADYSAKSRLKALVERAEVIQLAEITDFDETYLESMNF